MNNFKDIKSIYESQEKTDSLDVPQELRKRIKKADNLVNNSHVKNIIILSITLLSVACCDIFYFKSPSQLFQIGIITMLVALGVRIGIEILSYSRKKNLNVLSESGCFLEDLKGFYNWRKRIHKFPTYLTFSLYVIGVGLLFIEFHNYLSQFWFIFFLFEFFVIILVLIFFIQKKVRQEIKSLDELISMFGE